MKSIVMVILVVGIVLLPQLLSAQTAGGFNNAGGPVQTTVPDSIIQITAEAHELPLLPSDQLPPFGTFWLMQPGSLGAAPLPCPPGDPTLPVYQMAEGQYLVDGTGGQMPTRIRVGGKLVTAATVADALEAQAQSVLDLINLIFDAQLRQMARDMGMGVPLPGEDGEGGTNYFDSGFAPQVFTTNDLWLEISGATNTVSGMRAFLVIHPPWNVTNDVYDLFATTNLAPSAWQWVLRCDPGQTNLTVSGRADQMEFFILGLTTDTDTDGLTDAFEKLVSHTNPNSNDTDGDGVSDYVEHLQGRNPLAAGAVPDTNGLVNLQVYTPLP